MRKVSIRSDKNGHTRLIIDGVDVSSGCSNFVLEQEGGEFPKITVTMGCDDLDAEIEYTDIEIEKLTAPAATDAVNQIKV